MANAYKVLPPIYDRWQRSYGKDFSTIILPMLLSAFERYQIPTTSCIDLAGGTGSLALMLARRGWKVWSVDASEGMTKEAKKKFAGKTLPVKIVLQDMRKVNLGVQVQLVTCFFDSLNHLTSKSDLLKTFTRVRKHLEPGGYFLFDVNNEHCYTTLWRRTDAIHHKDFTIVLENQFDDVRGIAQSDVTVFSKKGKAYEKTREIVRQKHFRSEEISVLLRKVGFVILEAEDFNFTGHPEVGEIKTWWVAQKM